MKQRNKLFAGLSRAVAGAAIGAGAIVSANAMAASGEEAPADVLTMISVSSDGGQPVQCTFEGDEVTRILGDIPGAIPVAPGGGTINVISADVANGEPPEGFDGQIVGTGTITGMGDGDVVQIDEGGLPLPELQLPEGLPEIEVISADDAREGTPEECAAMLEATPPVGDQSGNTAVAVSGSATILSAEPVKP